MGRLDVLASDGEAITVIDQPRVTGANTSEAEGPDRSGGGEKPMAESEITRRTYTVEEAAEILGISRTTAYECIKSGEIPSLRFRRRIVIPAHAIEAMMSAA